MINKIGIDIIENARIEEKIEDLKFLTRILSSDELNVLNSINSKKRKVEYCAGRFASKEAIIKALPNEITNFSYSAITIANDQDGAPFVICPEFDFTIHISISHTDTVTAAFVVTEK